MNFLIRINIITCVLLCFFVAPCKAQKLASEKPLNELYNKKTNEKLVEINKTKHFDKSTEQKQNLPSMQPSLKDVADQKMKNTRIVPHHDPNLTIEEKKNNLASNSPKLKQFGKSVTKSQTLHRK